MNIKTMFDKINKLLEDTDYPTEIEDVSDLEEFLNDEDNTKYDAYDEIAELYELIVEGEDEEEEEDEESDDF